MKKFIYTLFFIIIASVINSFGQNIDLKLKWGIDSIITNKGVVNTKDVIFYDFCNHNQNILVATYYYLILLSANDGSFVKLYQLPNINATEEIDSSITIKSISISNDTKKFAVINSLLDFFVYNIEEIDYINSKSTILSSLTRPFLYMHTFAFSPDDGEIYITSDNIDKDKNGYVSTGIAEYNIDKKIFVKKKYFYPSVVYSCVETKNVNDSLMLLQFYNLNYYYTFFKLFNLHTFDVQEFPMKKNGLPYSNMNIYMNISQDFNYVVHNNLNGEFIIQSVKDTNNYIEVKSIQGFEPFNAIFSNDNYYVMIVYHNYQGDTTKSNCFSTIYRMKDFHLLLDTNLFSTSSCFSKVDSKYIISKSTQYNNFRLNLFEFNIVSVKEDKLTLFSISPNPVFDKLNLYNLPANAMSYEIYDQLGIKVNSGNIANEIDVSTLTAGIYFIKIDNEKVRKFVKI